LVALLYLQPFSPAAARQLDSAAPGTLVVIRGRVVCLDESGNRTSGLFGCDISTSRFGLVDRDEKLHSFDLAEASTAIFRDDRVRARDLQITARLNSKKQLELIKVQSVLGAKLYDIYYFCEICNIRAYAPGPCPCCRNELEFRETPP
jgi:hypothetical protein